MALQDMMNHIENEVQKQVEDEINKAKIESTQSLIALGEELDNRHEERVAHIKNQLQKKEDMLKAEQDFILANKNRSLENSFSDEMLADIESALIEYTKTNTAKYQEALSSWIRQVCDALHTDNIEFSVAAGDKDFVQKALSSLPVKSSVAVSPRISAGFVAAAKGGVTVDLSFESLFAERTQRILDISMQILKESL